MWNNNTKISFSCLGIPLFKTFNRVGYSHTSMAVCIKLRVDKFSDYNYIVLKW